MVIRVFTAQAVQQYPNIHLIAKDFKRYKSQGSVEFDTFKFGKDADYARPQSAKDAELQHVHIVPLDSDKNTSDRFLVYTRGFTDKNTYLILDILEPNAHELSRNMLKMALLADIAESFRSQY